MIHTKMVKRNNYCTIRFLLKDALPNSPPSLPPPPPPPQLNWLQKKAMWKDPTLLTIHKYKHSSSSSSSSSPSSSFHYSARETHTSPHPPPMPPSSSISSSSSNTISPPPPPPPPLSPPPSPPPLSPPPPLIQAQLLDPLAHPVRPHHHQHQHTHHSCVPPLGKGRSRPEKLPCGKRWVGELIGR